VTIPLQNHDEATAVNDLTPIPMPSISPFCGELPHGAFDGEVERLYAALDKVSWADNPRTARLLASGLRRKSQKVVEEAAEVALEAVRKRTGAVVRESADLLYHLVVLWHECGIAPEQVWAEMRQRADGAGLAEKPPKPPGRAATNPVINPKVIR
jgi:phosphoribosyl-ATP pyrophosphohydrolase